MFMKMKRQQQSSANPPSENTEPRMTLQYIKKQQNVTSKSSTGQKCCLLHYVYIRCGHSILHILLFLRACQTEFESLSLLPGLDTSQLMFNS